MLQPGIETSDTVEHRTVKVQCEAPLYTCWLLLQIWRGYLLAWIYRRTRRKAVFRSGRLWCCGDSYLAGYTAMVRYLSICLWWIVTRTRRPFLN